MGSLREAARDSRLAGGAWSRSLQARLGRVCSYDLSKSAAALPLAVSLRRARGAAPRGRGACELWGLCARPPAIRDWQGGLGLARSRLGSVEFVVMIYRNQPPRYP